MAKTLIPFFFPSSFVRVLPNTIGGQIGSPTILVGGSTLDNSSYAYDTALMTQVGAGGPGGLSYIDNIVPINGRIAHVAAFANQPGEIRLLFGGVEAVDLATLIAGMKQVQDYTPMAVPNDTTKWTVWRNIVIHDRFFTPVLANNGAANMTTYRIHWLISDRYI